MLYPGDTQQLSFKLPFSKDYIKRATISFSQQGVTMFTTQLTNMSALSNSTCLAILNMTQQQSLQLIPGAICTMQINVISSDGKRIPSHTFTEQVGEQLYKDII